MAVLSLATADSINPKATPPAAVINDAGGESGGFVVRY